MIEMADKFPHPKKVVVIMPLTLDSRQPRYELAGIQVASRGSRVRISSSPPKNLPSIDRIYSVGMWFLLYQKVRYLSHSRGFAR